MKRGIFAVVMSTAALLASAPVASAGDTQCVGVLTGSFDNVVVPSGATCSLTAQVKGNVKVYGSINVLAPTTIGGSLQSEPGHGFTRIFGGGVTVRGDVNIKGSTAGIAQGFLTGTTILGNFQYEENRGTLVANGPSVIRGNVKAEKNLGGGNIGPGLTIGGNVECKENTPAITEGGNNVSGTSRDKCPE